MKSINITGKKNIDKINKIEAPERKDSIHNKIDNTYYEYNKQISLINQLYLDNDIPDKNIFTREIKKKLNGYKQQDTKKEIYDDNYFITMTEVIEQLTISKLLCYYCKNKCELIYKNVNSKSQWTLDRLDNDYGHNKNNVVICCLECNIKRGSMNSERFKEGKNIRIVKKVY